MMTTWLWVYEAEKAASYEHGFPNAKVVHMKEVYALHVWVKVK